MAHAESWHRPRQAAPRLEAGALLCVLPVGRALLLEQLLVVVEELLLAGRVQLLEYGHDLGVGALTAAAIVLTPADQSSCIVDATSPRRMMGKWQIPAPVSPRLTPRGWQCCVCCRANIFGLHLVLAVGTGVGVTEKEFSITLSQASFSP